MSLTRFRLRGRRFWPLFMIHAQRSLMQIRKSEGYVAGALRSDHDLAFWTLTVWRDEKAMLGYVTSGAHRLAMPKLSEWASEASSARWCQTHAQLPDWDFAVERMRHDGREVAVRHPGPSHADVAFSESEQSQTVRI